MGKVNEKLGTNYDLFNYYGAPDADRVLIAMGSICDVAEEVIDYMNASGEKVGLIKVRLYRPFVAKKLVEAIPASVKKIAVLDRTKEPGALGEPLYLDVVTALASCGVSGIKVIGGRYGLGSKDTPPSSIFAAFENLAADEPKDHFTLGIVDDVTGLSLPRRTALIPLPQERSHANSGVSAATEPSAQTRTPSRSSATTPTSTYRLTSSMTPKDRRRDHLSPALRRRSDQEPVLHHQGKLRRMPQPVLHPEGIQDRQRRKAGRHVPSRLPVVRRRA